MNHRSFRGLVFAAILTARLNALEAGTSSAEVQLREEALEVTVAYDLADVQKLLPPGVILGTDSSLDTIHAARSELEALARNLSEIRLEGVVAQISGDVVIEFTPSDDLGFRFSYPRANAGVIAFRSKMLGRLAPTHQERFALLDEHGRTRVEKNLTTRNDSVEVSLLSLSAEPVAPTPAIPQTPALRRPAGGFLKAGIEHIWKRPDHVLFLFGLLIVCRTFHEGLGIIACFTLAHSLTLALATFGIVSVPSWIVDPALAASVLFVGAENLLCHREKMRGRNALTFAFGLIHGFAFANALRVFDVNADVRGMGFSLLTFNLGLELSLVAASACVLLTVWRLRKKEIFLRRGIPVLSAFVAAAGLYGLLARTLFA